MWLVAIVLDSALFISQESRSKMLSFPTPNDINYLAFSVYLTGSCLCQSAA